MSCNEDLSRLMHVERMGQVPYGPMLALQLARQGQVADGAHPDSLFLLQHSPVFTTGRGGGKQNLLWDAPTRARHGVALYATGRGGDVTYHGPGQLVAYPILQLQPGEQDLRQLVHRLEEAVIRTVADFGVRAQRVPGLRGVWVGNDKLAAVGVRVARWTSCHGVALNVDCDLAPFGGIVPCGLVGRGVTSLAMQLPVAPPMVEVEASMAAHMAAVFGRRAQPIPASALPAADAPASLCADGPSSAIAASAAPSAVVAAAADACGHEAPRRPTPCRSSYV